MAKIKKHIFQIRIKGQLENFATQIEYENRSFYIRVPEDILETVKTLESKHEELKIKNWVDRKGIRIYAIYAHTELELLQQFKTTIAYLKELRTTTRNVIIVHFDDRVQFGSGPTLTKSFIGYKIAYCYCSEVSSQGSEEKSYFMEQLLGGKRENFRVEIGYGFKGVVLPDTPENRATIESLYERSEKLINVLKELCQSEDNFLRLASETYKMLS